jgi:hypothetical protein
VKETVAPDDHAAMESPTPEVTVTMAVDPAVEVARIFTIVASTLVVVSSAQPTSFAADHSSSGLHLEEDVVLQFDATHRLSELTSSWGRLVAGAISFREQLHVVIFFFLCFLSSQLVLLSFLISFLFSAVVVFLLGSL